MIYCSLFFYVCILFVVYTYGDANHKSQYLYENLLVKSKMAFLSRILILLAILLYEHYIHHTQASICPKMQVFECSAVCLSVIIELLPGLIPFTSKRHVG